MATGPQTSQANPPVPSSWECVLHACVPVLAVARDQHTFDAAQSARVHLGVDVGAVRDVVAALLQPRDRVHLPGEVVTRPIKCVRSIERHLVGARAVVGAVLYRLVPPQLLYAW